MLDRLLENPLAAFAFLFFVAILIMVYFAQRERAKVNQMRGMRRFTPTWSSGRRHHRGRPGGRAEFSPQWSRRSRSDRSGGEARGSRPQRTGRPDADAANQGPSPSSEPKE